MNCKLNRPVKISEGGIIIQSQLFWLGGSPDEVSFDKNNRRNSLIRDQMRSNSLPIREIYPLKVLLLTMYFILPVTKMKMNI